MKIEDIIYQTTREIYSVEDKLRIATIFLFCEKIGSEKLAGLLYCDCFETFIDDLNEEYKGYDVDFNIRLEDRNVSNSFFKTINMYKEKNDKEGYLKALYNKDPYAIAIQEILKYNFDKVKMIKEINKQLSLF
jgi:hypothetical protein